jgi:hypothetical protein
VQYQKKKSAGLGTYKREVKVWAELYNPLPTDPTSKTDPTLTDGGAARMYGNGSARYRLAICMPKSGSTLIDDALRGNPKNVLGTPTLAATLAADGTELDFVYKTNPGGLEYAIVEADMAQKESLMPSGGINTGTADQGYYVIGPTGPALSGLANPLTVTSSKMTYNVSVPAGTGLDDENPPAVNPPDPPTLLLQRLACPHMPWNGEKTDKLNYNPWITVDYMKDVDKDSTTGFVYLANRDDKDEKGRKSDGRMDPYVANPTNPTYRSPQTGPDTTKNVQHTFFSVNTPKTTPFSWLVHADRQINSPMELLHVSAFRPFELTQEFKNTTTGKLTPFNHRVPWFDEDQTAGSGNSHRLYRLFEFIETRSRVSGLEAPATKAKAGSNVTVSTVTALLPTEVEVTPETMTGITASGLPVSIQVGSTLVIAPPSPSIDAQGLSHENVVVTAVTATTFKAKFFKSHTAPFEIRLTDTGDRVPGKINVNTMWDAKTDANTLLALADSKAAGGANNFTDSDVTTIYGKLVDTRMPGDTTYSIAAGSFSEKDKPFWGMGMGTYASAPGKQFDSFGLDNTFFRAYPGGTTRLFEAPAGSSSSTHPYARYELMSKIFNNVTTRSNVFAVWLTVGFFEVTDDTVRPVKLGAEIGRSENRNVRHRMFAIVDRTALKARSALIGADNKPAQLTVPIFGTGPQVAQVNWVTGNLTPPGNWTTPGVLTGGLPWSLQTGSLVVIGTGTNQEIVTISSASQTSTLPAAGKINAVFTKPHSIGEIIYVYYVVPGNPGPVDRFNPRDPLYQDLVPYLSIIN